MSLFSLFRRPQLIRASSAQECPNCWGYSEWANRQTKASFKMDKGSFREIGRRNGFIRKFMKKHLR